MALKLFNVKCLTKRTFPTRYTVHPAAAVSPAKAKMSMQPQDWNWHTTTEHTICVLLYLIYNNNKNSDVYGAQHATINVLNYKP